MAGLKLYGVTVSYPVVLNSRQRSALANAANTLSFGRYGRGANVDYVQALRDVSVDIPQGGRLGVIGRNGSGKSTLLKTAAGIIRPSRGRREVNGKVGCVLNLGAGLDPDKSGLENMRMIARLHGLDGEELDAAVEDAAAFTELEAFLEMPVRAYSSGMGARLNFAIATAQRSDVMIIDEVIGTGDAYFVSKAVDRVRALCDGAGVLMLATHSYAILRDFCDRAIWLDAGRVVAEGNVDEVWEAYYAAHGG
ncbi:MAG: ABC transporter ATP-binding protein [Caulobacterales bacterium]|nr:ABC transporter ATP-binding protein [Caulobacterales bacterium]